MIVKYVLMKSLRRENSADLYETHFIRIRCLNKTPAGSITAPLRHSCLTRDKEEKLQGVPKESVSLKDAVKNLGAI